uniref:Condensin-2 complex subunit H2 n=1 Tax=Monodelphis domestica TaxID=13616 RepID=K7E0P5_MONDO
CCFLGGPLLWAQPQLVSQLCFPGTPRHEFLSSRHVSPRQVEYLYSLVYQALDFISGKKRNKQPTSVQPDGHDEDASCGAHPEPEEEFLSLDDLADPRANIDLKNDQTPNAVLVIPLVPMALVPPDEEEKKNSPLYRYSLPPRPLCPQAPSVPPWNASASALEPVACGLLRAGVALQGLLRTWLFASTAGKGRSWPAVRISG